MPRSEDVVSYRTLLRLPGALPTFIASSLGRLSYGTIGLALLLAVERATGSFAVAGLASASYGVGALAAPLKSRWIDRFGQRRVVAFLGALCSAALLGLAGAVFGGARNQSLYVALAGFTGFVAPPLGPATRAVWATLTDGVATRHRAYSFDVGVEDTLFTVGPLLVGALVVLDGPTLALAVASLLMFIGSVSFARSPAVSVHDGRAVARNGTPLTHILRSSDFVTLLGIVAVLSTCLGIVDVSVAARAVENGTPAAAGYVLAGMTLGSVIGGQLWGRRTRSGSPSTQFALLSAALTFCLASAAAAPNLVVFAVALVALGTVIAPILVLSFVAAENLVPTAGRTEASTWVGVSFNAGIAMGSALGGFVLVRTGSTGSFLSSTAISAIVPVFMVALRKRLLRSLSGSTFSSDRNRREIS